MLAYYIVCLTYYTICLFSLRRPAVPITLGPPPMLWAYGLNLLIFVHILLASHRASKAGKYGFPAVPTLKMAIASRHAEGQWTNEVCRPQQ